MVDYRLQDFWTIARAIRQGNLKLFKTMEVLAQKSGIVGQQASRFVITQQLERGT